jgi:uncharacterized DUF497 family protein
LDNNEIKYSVAGLFFTWDDEKRQNNIEKHNGITFEMAAEIFDDPDIIYFDPYREN